MPGALEIPAAIAFAARGGDRRGKTYDGYVALGCVIRGETYHFEIVAERVARGTDGSRPPHGLCIGNGILTVENEEQAMARAGRDGGQGRRCGARLPGADRTARSRLGARR